jgi:rhodanese-related sulfurtransferase
MKNLSIIVVTAFFLAGVSSVFTFSAAEEVKEITKEELKPLLEDAAVVVLDVRVQSHWNGSGAKIKGSVREDPNQVKAWMEKYGKDKTLVFYCA